MSDAETIIKAFDDDLAACRTIADQAVERLRAAGPGDAQGINDCVNLVYQLEPLFQAIKLRADALVAELSRAPDEAPPASEPIN